MDLFVRHVVACRAAALKSRAYTYECYGCGRPDFHHGGHGDAPHKASVDGMVLGRAFDIEHMQTGMSGAALEIQLGLDLRTAWLLAQKLRRSMVEPRPLSAVSVATSAVIFADAGSLLIDF